MRATVALVLSMGLLIGCGGGGGSAATAETPLFPLSDNRLTFQPKTIHYQVTGAVVTGEGEPVPIEGTASTRQGQPATVGGVLCTAVDTVEILDTHSPVSTQEFYSRDEDANRAMQAGLRLGDGALINWHTPMARGPLVYEPGESWSLEDPNYGYMPTPQGAQTRMLVESYEWSVDRKGIIEVPAGRFECYVVYTTLRQTDLQTGVGEVCSTISYVRPDYGVIQAETRISRVIEGVPVQTSLTYEATKVY